MSDGGLHSLGGEPAPDGVATDLRRLLALPISAQQRLWEVLGPSLREPVPPGVGASVARFCATHGVPEADLAPAIRACRFLLRGAATEDLDAGLFRDDLAVVAGEDAPALADVLLPGFAAAKDHVRGELRSRSLSDHGKTLEGVEWRLDMATAGSRGKNLRLPVVQLTLTYRENGRAEQVTFQVAPDVLRRLRAVLGRIGL